MKIIDTYNLINFKNHNLIRQKQQKNTSEETTGKNFKDFSNAVTALNKALITFKAKKPAPDKQTLLRLLEEGKSENEMAEIMGEDVKRIHTALLRYGLIKTNHDFIAKNEPEIRKLLVSGKTGEEIAEILGCSTSTISNAREKLGISYKSSVERNKDKIIRMYREGATQQEIADFIGSRQTSISNALKRWGVEPRLRTTENFKDIIIEMYKQGATQQEIAGVVNCSIAAVKNTLINNGVELRPKTNIEDIKDTIVQFYNEGKNAKEISKATGYSTSTIYSKLREWGLTSNSSASRGITELKKEEIIDLHKQGYTSKEIAEIIGCSNTAIYNALVKWGILDEHEIKNRNSLLESNKELIIKLYIEGAEIKEIADVINCDRSSVSHALTRWGIKLNGKKIEKNKDKIIEMYEQGISIFKIASFIGCSYKGVDSALRKWGKK